MKRIVCLLLILTLVLSGFPQTAGASDVDKDGNLYLNEKNFPDEKFRAYLKENFANEDENLLSEKQIREISELNVENLGIESLEGIQFFRFLRCWFVPIIYLLNWTFLITII